MEFVLNSEPKLRNQFARFSEIPEVLIELSRDEFTRIRNSVVGNTFTPLKTLEELASDPQASVRYQVALNRRTPLSALEKLSQDSDSDVRSALCWNWNRLTGKIILNLFADQDPKVRSAISDYVSKFLSSEETLGELVKFENLDIQIATAKNIHCDDETFNRLLRINSADLHLILAKNQFAPEEVLFKLSQINSIQIRVAVAENPSTSPQTLSLLAHDKSEYVRVKVAKRSLDIDSYRTLAADKLANVRAKIALNSDAPLEILRELSLDSSIMVKKAIINNKKVGEEMGEIINNLKSSL